MNLLFFIAQVMGVHRSIKVLSAFSSTQVPNLLPSLFRTSLSQRVSSLDARFTLKRLICVGVICRRTRLPVDGSMLTKSSRPDRPCKPHARRSLHSRSGSHRSRKGWAFPCKLRCPSHGGKSARARQPLVQHRVSWLSQLPFGPPRHATGIGGQCMRHIRCPPATFTF